jgi:hypothetical protein
MAFFWLLNGFFSLPAAGVKSRAGAKAAECKWLLGEELGGFVAL